MKYLRVRKSGGNWYAYYREYGLPKGSKLFSPFWGNIFYFEIFPLVRPPVNFFSYPPSIVFSFTLFSFFSFWENLISYFNFSDKLLPSADQMSLVQLLKSPIAVPPICFLTFATCIVYNRRLVCCTILQCNSFLEVVVK